MRLRTALLALAVVAAGCGGGRHAPPPRSEREWTADAKLLAGELDDAVDQAAQSGADAASAARTLREPGRLYLVLVGYTALGHCDESLANAGTAPRRLRPAARLLREACARFERAASLFERATTEDDPRLLVEAQREALAGAPLVARARSALPASPA